ncbi:HipA N-terminal domain-containing protein [Stutzerimonas chloritidismutans]|uniref:HipA N-terminal domain-containing protein n=1 Tax=Stutzerimonas chloritidismutans TaxID=203192 RepID=UPI002110F4BB|nr:HipA N-terminal domain-containing protein [Stutzerimonas chloritidismutans]
MQWYFDNLLPEEGQRTLLAGSAQLDAHDAFALLAHYGAESAGSVTLLVQGTSQAPHATHPLSDEALSRRIQQSSGAAASRSKANRPCRVPRRSTGADGRSSAGAALVSVRRRIP